jgi:hypothetical protein
MNIDEFRKCFEAAGLIKNTHHFERYLKLMMTYKGMALKKSKDAPGAVESHHILPEAIWPEYGKEYWNKVKLPVKAHLIAHYLLFKSIDHSACVFAFNMMCGRVPTDNGFFSTRYYEQVRIAVAIEFSKLNTGQKRSDTQRENLSRVHSGTNIYRNQSTGELKRYKVDEQPAGWEPFQTGRERSVDSRAKVGDSNRGRIWQYNEETKEVLFEHEIQEGFTKGAPPWFNNGSDALKEYKWTHDPLTGKNVRCKLEDIPEGYVLGRGPNYVNAGYIKLNHSNLVKRLDIVDKCYVMIEEEKLPDPRYIKHGASIDKIYVIGYKNNLYYS